MAEVYEEMSDYERRWGVHPLQDALLRLAELERANRALTERVEKLEGKSDA